MSAPMTDDTTARDRAIEVLAGVIGYDERDGEPHALTGEIVDALLARPDVLRALAGAPTADVAECSTPMRHPLTVCPICHPAAPEGVDATDERMRFVGWSVDRVDGSSSFGTFDRRESADEWCERLRGYGNDVHVVPAEVPDRQDAMADELTAAHAAIQRVRPAVREALRLLDDWQTAEELGTVEEWALQISEALLPLAGDTTEEKR